MARLSEETNKEVFASRDQGVVWVFVCAEGEICGHPTQNLAANLFVCF